MKASSSPAARRLAAQAPDLTSEALLALLEDPYRAVRRAAAQRIQALTDEALLTRLAQHRFVEARRAASQHSKTPPDLLQSLYKAGATRDLSSFAAPQPLSAEERALLLEGGIFARCLLARHPDTPEALRVALQRDPAVEVRAEVNAYFSPEALAAQPYRVRRAAAKNPGAPSASLARLAKDPHPNVRAEVARNISSPSALFEPMLRGERGTAVQRAAAQNPNLPKEWLSSLMQRYPVEVLRNPVFPLWQLEEPDLLRSLPHSTKLKLAQHKPLPGWLAHCLFAEDYPQLLLALSQNSTTPPDLLARLAASAKVELRANAARNPNTPQEALALLYKAGASADLKVVSAPREELSAQELTAISEMGALGRAMVLRDALCTEEARLAAISEDPEFYGGFLLQHLSLVSAPMLKELLEVKEGMAEQTARLAAHHLSLPLQEVAAWSLSGAALEALATRPSLPTALIEHLLQENQERSLLKLIEQQVLSEAQQRRLALSEHTRVRQLLAKHPGRPAAFLRRLWEAGAYYDLERSVDKPQAYDPDFLEEIAGLGAFGANLAAKNPGTPSATLEALFRAPALWPMLATNPSLPAPLLAQLAGTSKETLHLALLENPELPSALLSRLHDNTKNITIKTKIAEHPNTSKELLVALSQSEIYQVRDAAARNPTAPLATLHNESSYTNETSLRQLVKRYDIDAVILWRLATCAFPYVREAAAQHPRFSEEKRALLVRLGLSPYLNDYGEPDTTLRTEHLSILARQSPLLKALVLLHPNVTEEMVAARYREQDQLLRFRAQLFGEALRTRLSRHPPAAWLRAALREHLGISC